MTAPTALPQASDLAAFLGPSAPEVDSTQAAALIAYVAQLVSAATRGVGFTAGVPNADLWQLILGATARVYAHPRQLPMSETAGEESADFRQGFGGFSVAEMYVIKRYRKMAE